jgi:hypothetical protein
MKRQNSCGPRLGKLVHQLPGVVTFAYNLCFRRMIARWKGIIEEIHFRGSIMPSDIFGNLDIENPSFRPSKWLRKLKPAKNNKLSKLPECCFEPVGKVGWPSISRHMIARWKGMIEEIHFGVSIMPSAIIENLNLEKPSFGPAKWPRKLKLAKINKLPKLPESCFGQVGKAGWPPIST